MGCCTTKQHDQTPAKKQPSPKDKEMNIVTAHDTNAQQSAQPISKGMTYIIKREKFVQTTHQVLDTHFRIGNRLGNGSYGMVYEVIDKRLNIKRAMKTIDKTKIKNCLEELIGEVEILKTLNHPNIIKIYEIIEEPRRLHIITELCTGGELYENIIACKRLTENKAAYYMQQLLSAVSYCHSHGIVHRDLKPENLLLQSDAPDAPLKVIDFGTSRRFTTAKALTKFVGTVYYIAPEVLKEQYDEKCDVWSCGVILYIMLCGTPPFNGKSDAEIFNKIRYSQVTFNQPEWRNVSRQAKEFIRSLLSKTLTARPSASQAYMHPWIQQRANGLLKDQKLAKSALNHLMTYNVGRQLERAVLAYISSHLTAENELEELRKTFMKIDTDGNGSLTKSELIYGFNQLDIEIENIDTLLEKCDTDGNGVIDYQEFITATMDWKATLNRRKLTEVFRTYDKDGSGTVDIYELKAALGGDSNESNEIWIEMLKEADSDNNGVIDLDEFIKYMMNQADEFDNRV